ncbi:MAG: DAK2 domain-containing protein [Clostridia bacterium]|nr:DAK2 domain-containing protein [Clostridia bacterium]
MTFRKINGTDLEKMLCGGLESLRRRESEINDLNVFPVPDGDTGTNMRLTLESGLRKAVSSPEAGTYLRGLGEGMLLGARGNSGVILSQLFRGFCTELSRCSYVGPGELRDALIRGYRTAYSSVVRPVEGTILTVAREGIEHIRGQIVRSTPVDRILAMYIAEMKKSLLLTPELLGVLKEAGVVDSGAAGYIAIVEGMLGALRGEMPAARIEERPSPAPHTADLSFFGPDSAFEYGYCMEFILQLMRSADYSQRFREESFISDLDCVGDSLAVVRDGDRVKVHIHTKRPEKVITLAREFGEFVTFKLENMQLQHNEHVFKTSKAPKGRFARVAVVNGEGMKSLFSGLGCEVVIDGGRGMNTSSSEFIEAFRAANAETVAVLPCNKNLFETVRQAAGMFKESKIELIEASTVPEGYYALAMDVPESDDISFRLSQMREGASAIKTFSLSHAVREYRAGGISVSVGDAVAISGGEVVASGELFGETAVRAIKAIPGAADAETFMVFCRDINDAEGNDELASAISESFPMADVSFLDGGQELHRYIIGAV